MSTLIPVLLGFDQPRKPSPRLSRGLRLALVFFIAAFYLANSFSSPLTAVLIQAKWIPLALLAAVAGGMLYRRHAPRAPMAMVVAIGALGTITAATCWTSVDPAYSALAWVTTASSIACGYFLSALIIATDTRRAFFELLASVGRYLIIITFLFMVLGINLGRGSNPAFGGGFTAWSDNPNTLAAILTPCVVIFFAGCLERRPGWLVWHAFFLLLGFMMIWATNARASIIWLSVSMAVFWVYRRGPGVAAFGTIFLLIVLIGWWEPIEAYLIETLGLDWSVRTGQASPLSGREEVWRVGWDLFWQRPVMGYGLGTSQEIIEAESWRFFIHQGLHFHSSYIMVAVEGGIFSLIAFMAGLIVTLARGFADSGRTAMLPRESWPTAALPLALVFGSLGHALFESWLIAPGNANMMLFWTWAWMVHHQSQVKVRAVGSGARPQLPMGTALPAR